MRTWCLVVLPVLLFAAGDLFAQTPEQIAVYEQKIEEQQRQLDALRAELEELKKAVGTITASAEEPEPEPEAEPVISEDVQEPLAASVLRKTENGTVQLSGRVHRMLMNVDDGVSRTGLFADSDQGPTMFRIDGFVNANDDLTVHGIIELGVQHNKAFALSQDRVEAGTATSVRLAEIQFAHKRIGKFSFGRGFASSWVSPEIDASGTQLASLVPVGMLAPSLKFVDSSDNSLSSITVGEHFNDVERLLRMDRVRYDSPIIGNGLQLSGTAAADDRWDATVRYKPKVDGWSIMASGAYMHKPFRDISNRTDLGFSARHEGTGLNITVGTSRDELAGVNRDANGYIVKAGWLTDLNKLGKTAFAVDYFTTEDLRLAGDKAESIGLIALQNWAAHRLTFYGAYRIYDVSRSDINLKDLNVLYIGTAFSF